MPRLTLATMVELLLAFLFALTMGIAIAAVLVADFMQPGRIMSAPQRQTLLVCGLAGFGAALVAWWLQTYAANRGILVRFLYALAVFMVMFGAFGGLLEVTTKYLAGPGGGFSLSGIYWTSLSGFYAFVLFLLTPVRLALFLLFVAAGLILAIVGPQSPAAPAKRARN